VNLKVDEINKQTHSLNRLRAGCQFKAKSELGRVQLRIGLKERQKSLVE
jgi:hypothetical protein